ncbi:MAG: hypothetical protein WBA22_11845 [Candidatus Methanofastidiosia archaeon]
MPEVRLDMDGEKSDKKKEGFLAEIVGDRGIIALEYSGIPHIRLDSLDFPEPPVRRRLAYLLAEMLWHASLIFNGGARILRAIASWVEFHLSPSYVLFNLKALSVVVARKVVLGEKLFPVVDIGDCYGR